MSAPVQRLFVYGSLRSDLGDRAKRGASGREILAAGANLEGPASAAGWLYAVSWHPAFTPGKGARVRGEVWRLNDDGLLARLDAWEGASYAREAFPVMTDDGRRVTAWIYRWTADLAGVPPIPSGDYLQWLEASQ